MPQQMLRSTKEDSTTLKQDLMAVALARTLIGLSALASTCTSTDPEARVRCFLLSDPLLPRHRSTPPATDTSQAQRLLASISFSQTLICITALLCIFFHTHSYQSALHRTPFVQSGPLISQFGYGYPRLSYRPAISFRLRVQDEPLCRDV